VVPQVGYITQILQPPINYIIIAVIIGVMVVKHFAGKEKKKIEFQYRNDEVDNNNPYKITENDKDSEISKVPEEDESIKDDKKEL
jgi:signal peptidase